MMNLEREEEKTVDIYFTISYFHSPVGTDENMFVDIGGLFDIT
jgi:hypothetical protein